MAAATLLKINIVGWGTTRELTIFNPAQNVYYIDAVTDELKALIGINGLPESPLEIEFPTVLDRSTFLSDLTAGLLSSYAGPDPLILSNGRDTGRPEQTTTTTTTAGPEITTTEDPALTTTSTTAGPSTSTTTSTTAAAGTTSTTTTTTPPLPILYYDYQDNSLSNSGSLKIYKNGFLSKTLGATANGHIAVRAGDVISASLTTVSGVESNITFFVGSTELNSYTNSSGSVVMPNQAPLTAGLNYSLVASIYDA